MNDTIKNNLINNAKEKYKKAIQNASMELIKEGVPIDITITAFIRFADEELNKYIQK